jgi:hypothetical protein
MGTPQTAINLQQQLQRRHTTMGCHMVDTTCVSTLSTPPIQQESLTNPVTPTNGVGYERNMDIKLDGTEWTPDLGIGRCSTAIQ